MPKRAQQGESLAEAVRDAASSVLIAGKYRLEAEIGRGGMGAVYAARHAVTGRRFAIKLLGGALRGDAGAEERFVREAMLASSIQHPAIIEVYDVGCDDGQPYMVMKLVEGETLSERIDRGPFALQEAIAILLPVIDAIAAAHACGIVHRDLKPDNIMLEGQGAAVQPRVLDFGISKLVRADARPKITSPGMLLGTPSYMAPEQVRGESNLDGRTDIYALGVILYEMLTGELPYDADDCQSLLRKIVAGGAPGLRTHRPDLPVELEAVVARAMAGAREQRYQDAAQLARDLARAGSARALPTPAPLPAAARPASSITPLSTPITVRVVRPRSAAFHAGLGLAALALVLALAWVSRSMLITPVSEPMPRAAASRGSRPLPSAAPATSGVTLSTAPSTPPASAAPAVAPSVSIETVRQPEPSLRAPASGKRPERDALRARRVRRAAAERPADAGAPSEGTRPGSLPSITSELLDPFD